MSEKLIKSKHRVQKHGEVFTPNWMVERMLNRKDIKEACENLTVTFLEPAAGEGNFLMAILKRKLKMIEDKHSETLIKYENYSLYALSTIYGIELLEDNAQMCVINLYEIYKESYSKIAMKFGENVKNSVLSSAKVIISSNIAQGNFLTKQTPDGKPIVFSEWRSINQLRKDTQVIKISRTEYSLDDIISGSENKVGSITKPPKITEQLDLFDSFDDDFNIETEVNIMYYIIVKITEVYNEETENG